MSGLAGLLAECYLAISQRCYVDPDRRQGSPGMRPDMTSRNRARSRTVRVITPSVASPSHTSPKSGPAETRPRLGFSPTIPHSDAGIRSDAMLAVVFINQNLHMIVSDNG